MAKVHTLTLFWNKRTIFEKREPQEIFQISEKQLMKYYEICIVIVTKTQQYIKITWQRIKRIIALQLSEGDTDVLR